MTDLARHVTDAADTIARANHATFRAVITPPEAYDVVGSLGDLGRRLPQLLDFLTRSMTRAEPAEYFDDRGGEAALALHVAMCGLIGARRDLADLAFHLDQTHNALGHLGRINPED